MANPFDNDKNLHSMEVVFQKMKDTMSGLEAFRELVAMLSETADVSKCRCVADELEQFCATLFGLHQTLHVYGVMMHSHLSRMRLHEAHQKALGSAVKSSIECAMEEKEEMH